MSRSLSHSEIASLLDCQAQHDFRYVGRLASDALAPKTTAPLLSRGRAWGAGVAAYHATPGVIDGLEAGQAALAESLEEDAHEQRENGLYDPDQHVQTHAELGSTLTHYIATSTQLPITRLEHELDVAIPSRTGRRRSNAYRLLCRLDGVHQDTEGRWWIVEFKLRNQLWSLEQITLSRQIRWYAWAWRETTGIEPAGVIVDERLNVVPAPVKFNQDGRPSKVQSCQPDDYQAACEETDTPLDPNVYERLIAKVWQHRHRVLFRTGELDEVGWQLVSAARLVHDLESGRLFPIRNPSRMRCPGCAYREICPDPGDTALVDALFERVVAKRDRKEAALAA